MVPTVFWFGQTTGNGTKTSSLFWGKLIRRHFYPVLQGTKTSSLLWGKYNTKTFLPSLANDRQWSKEVLLFWARHRKVYEDVLSIFGKRREQNAALLGEFREQWICVWRYYGRK